MKKILILFLIVFLPLISLAVGAGGSAPTIQNPIKVKTITELINLIFEIIVTVGTPFLVFMIILVGFRFVNAKGDSGKLKTAKDSFMWTLIGAAIILGAWVIEKALENTVDQLKEGVVHSGATISYNLDR